MSEKKTNPLIFAAIISAAFFVASQAWRIYEQGGGEFADTRSLQDLESVDGDLRFENGRMAHVHGLANLSYLGGTLDLSGNDLPSIEGLSSLGIVKGGLDLSDNRFYALTPLVNLYQVEGSIDLRDNSRLFNIAALGELQILGGSLYLDPDIHLRQDFLGIPADSYLCAEVAKQKFRGVTQSQACQSNGAF